MCLGLLVALKLANTRGLDGIRQPGWAHSHLVIVAHDLDLLQKMFAMHLPCAKSFGRLDWWSGVLRISHGAYLQPTNDLWRQKK